MAILMLLVGCVPLSTGQLGGNPNPDFNIDCPDSTIEIEVGPGDRRTGSVTCIVENPSIYVETVNISVSQVTQSTASPGSISIPANSETSFTVTYGAESAAEVASFTSSIEATLSTVNNLPYPLGQTKSESVNIVILPFGRPTIDMEPQEIILDYGQTTTLNFSMRNTGNYEDTLSVTLENRTGLEEFGFTFDFSVISATLGVNQSKELVLTITASDEILDGSFVVILLVDSKLAEDAGESWVVEENFRLQSFAKEESFLTASVDNVPAWAVTVAMVLAGLAGVGVIVVVGIIMMKRRGTSQSTSETFNFDDDFGDDFTLEGDEFDDFGLDDL